MVRPLVLEHVSIPLGLGVETKMDSRLVDAPQLLSLQNAVLSTLGSIGKRNGYENILSAAEPTNYTIITAGVRGDDLFRIGNQGLESFNGTRSTWLRNRIPSQPLPLDVTLRRFRRESTAALRCDVAANATLTAIAWDDGAEVYVSVFATETSEPVLYRQTPFSAIAGVGTHPRLAFMGADLIVSAAKGGAGGEIFASVLNQAAGNFTFGPTASISGAAGFMPHHDLVEDNGVGGGALRIHLACCASAAGNDLRLRSFNVALANIDTFNHPGPADCGSAITIVQHTTDNRLFIGMGQAAAGGAVNVVRINRDYTGVSAVTAVHAGPMVVEGLTLIQTNPAAAPAGAGVTGYWVVNGQADTTGGITAITSIAGVAGAVDRIHWRSISTALAIGAAHTNENMALASKGFHVASYNSGTRACFLAAYQYSGATLLPNGDATPGSAQSCYYVTTIPQDELGQAVASPLHVFGRVDQDFATYGAADSPDHIPNAARISATRFRVPFLSRAVAVRSVVDTSFNGVDYADLNFAPIPAGLAERGGCTFISGGMLHSYDGGLAREASLNVSPERPYYEDAGVVGSGVDAVAHRYVVIWEMPDGLGHVLRSAPSPILEVPALAANSQIDIHFPRITQYSQRNGAALRTTIAGLEPNLMAVVYRTTTDGLFHRTVSGVPAASAVTGLVFLSDITTDLALESRERLYTEGGVRAAFPPPHNQSVVFTKDRCWVASGTELWFSKPLQPRFAPEFSAVQVIEVPEGEGDITALAVLDDRIVCFKASDMFSIEGNGPDELGQNGAFSPPLRIASDVGCTSPRSPVLGPDGILFQSARGIYRLGRDLTVEYVGAPVEGLLGTNLIRRGVLIEAGNEIRFLVPALNQVIVYDMFLKQWSVHTNFTGATDAVLWGGRFSWLLTNGRGRRERLDTDASRYADLDANDALIFTSSSFEIPWIKSAGLQGFKRVRRFLALGDRVGAHTLTVSARYDYEPTYTTTWTFTDAIITAIRYRIGDASATRYQLGLNVPRQKVQSISLRFTDANATASGGFRLTGLEMWYARKTGVMRLPAAALG